MTTFNLNNSRITVPDGVTSEQVVEVIAKALGTEYGRYFSGRVGAFEEPSRFGHLKYYLHTEEVDKAVLKEAGYC
jgi:hypothetical protein